MPLALPSLGPVTGTWVWVGRVQVRVNSKSPAKNPHPGPRFGTDATTHQGHKNMSPEHNDAEVERGGGDEKCQTQARFSDEGGMGRHAHPHERFYFN